MAGIKSLRGTHILSKIFFFMSAFGNQLVCCCSRFFHTKTAVGHMYSTVGLLSGKPTSFSTSTGTSYGSEANIEDMHLSRNLLRAAGLYSSYMYINFLHIENNSIGIVFAKRPRYENP